MITKIADSFIAYWKFVYIIIVTTVAYFDPIKDIIQVIMLFFIIDMIYGWRADKKKNGAKFKTSIVWETTIPRMIASVIIMICTYLLDEVTGQEYIRVYSIAGWLIMGLLIISISKNMYEVTKWNVLNFLGRVITKKIESQTGESLDFEKS